MKKIITIAVIFSLILGSNAFAGNDKETGNSAGATVLTGKVFDMNTLEELAGVTVQIEGTDLKAYTDMEGNFKFEGVQPGTYSLNISYISYKEKELTNINVSRSDNTGLEIKLEQVN
jgi:hypothetical protein